MESRRRSKWDNYRRPQNKRASRVCWQPAVPSWEKEFCKVIGSLDWEALLQMKKFMHLYDNVIKWNDIAGEEAFCNAKKRFWAKISGLQCDIPLPDPDVYIDKIDWNSEINPELLSDLECNPVIPNTEEDHDPVIIFGDSLISNQAFSSSGWGENEEKLNVPTNSSSANHGDPWEQNWSNAFNNEPAIGWPGFSNYAWYLGNGQGHAGYMPCRGGSNKGWGWNFLNNHPNYEVGPENFREKRAVGENRTWIDNNVPWVDPGRYVSSCRISNSPQNSHYGNHRPRNDVGRHKATFVGNQFVTNKILTSREWISFNSCGPVGHRAAITTGQPRNQEKHVS